MSADVYSRILWWDGEQGRGIVKSVEVTVTLRAPPSALPHIADIDFGEVDLGTPTYRPEIREYAGDKRREMEPAEIEAVQAWLAELRREVLTALKEHHVHFAVEAIGPVDC